MKKNSIISSLAGLALALGFASCSSEDFNVANGGDEAAVNVTVSLPGNMGSRAFADGLSADKLMYGVYEVTGATGSETFAKKIESNQSFGSSLSTNVPLRLISGKKYQVFFWAQSSSAATDGLYTVTFGDEAASIAVDYSKMSMNDDNCDAYFGSTEIFTVTADCTIAATLTRPFAQINVGTDDYNAYCAAMGSTTNDVAVKTAISISSCYTKLNLMDGEASDPTTSDLTFAAIDPSTEAFPVGSAYKYMAMLYVLQGTGATTPTANINITFTDGSNDINTIPVASAPIQRNYRTNIYGSLLTSSVNVTVTKDNEFEAPAQDIFIGTEAQFLAALEAGGEYVLSNDITLESNLVSSHDLQINLANHTLTIPSRIQTDQNSTSKLSISGGKIVQETSDVLTLQVTSGNTLELSDVVIESKAQKTASNIGRVINCTSGSTLKMDNVKIVSEDENCVGSIISGNAQINNSSISTKSYAIQAGSNSNLTISGNTEILSENNAALLIGSSNGSTANVIVEGNVSITSEGDNAIKVQNNTTATIKGATITSKAKHGISAMTTSSILLENCIISSNTAAGNAGCAVTLQDQASITATGCTFNSNAYGASTNAGAADACDMTFDNCIFNAQIGILYNIDATLSAKDCTFNAGSHGVIARGGDVTLDHCSLNISYPVDVYADNIESIWLPLYINNWESGSDVPVGALVMGNRTDSGYRYPTKVTLKNGCKLSANHTGDAADVFYLLYAYANQVDGKGVTFDYDNSTVFETATCKSPYIVYDSDNITVNGVATKTDLTPAP